MMETKDAQQNKDDANVLQSTLNTEPTESSNHLKDLEGYQAHANGADNSNEEMKFINDDTDISNLPKFLENCVNVKIVIPVRPPSWIEAFLGTMFDIREELEVSLKEVNLQIDKLFPARHANPKLVSNIWRKQMVELFTLRSKLKKSLEVYQWTALHIWLYQWSLAALLLLTSIFQIIVVIIYTRWHGVDLLSSSFYSTEQVNLLSTMTFVNGPTTMSIIAEILTWSALGVWASYSHKFGKSILKKKFRFGEDGVTYITNMIRNTSVVAAVIILLRLSQFSIFGITIADNTALGFDSTVGLSFLLGFFGDDATRLLLSFKDLVLGKTQKRNNEEVGQSD